VSFNLSDMLFAIINFAAMAFILNKVLFKPVLKVLDDRQNMINAVHRQAWEAKQEAEADREQYSLEMKKLRIQTQEIMERALKAGEESKNIIIADAKANAESMMQRTREELELEKEKAKQELRSEVAELAVLAAGKLVQQTLRAEDHEKLIEEFIHEVGDPT